MNKEDITQKFTKAKELVSGIEESHQRLALEVVFRWLLDQSLGPVERVATKVGPSISRSTALNEFLSSRKPTSHKDRILLVAYYYLHSKNEPVTRAEIDGSYTLARMVRPRNLSDIIAKCVAKGYLMEHPVEKGGNRAWQITQTGERHLQEQVAKT